MEYQPDADPTSRFTPTEQGLEISMVRAQRLYNNQPWPNPSVVKLKKARFQDGRS